MNNQFVIKLNKYYYDDYITGFRADLDKATRYIHSDVAKQKIIDLKLPEECKVYQINFVEQEVK